MTRLASRRAKYGAEPVCACGHTRVYHPRTPVSANCLIKGCECEAWQQDYPSKAEAARGAELALLERAGVICNLKRQVRYPLVVNGVRIGEYRSDFEYDDLQTGKHVVEDTKGFATPTYRLKRLLMRACWGIEIQESQ